MTKDCACGATLAWEDDQMIDVYTGERHNCPLWHGSKNLTIAEKKEIEMKRKLPGHCRACGDALTIRIFKAMATAMQALYCKRCRREIPFSRKPIPKDDWQERNTYIIKCPNCNASYSSVLRVCPGCMFIMEQEVKAERNDNLSTGTK